MPVRTIEVEKNGGRLDAVLSEYMPDLSRSFIQKVIEAGGVKLNGRAVKKSYKPLAGDVFELDLPEPQVLSASPQQLPLSVVYEDDDVIVVNKSRGMVVHPAPGHADGTLVNALMFHCGNSLSGINGIIRPGIVHRIDKDTSGLIIAAKNDSAHRCLAEQLKDHSLSRTYAAVICGNLKDNTGTVNAPIGRHPNDRKRQYVTEVNSRNAVTHWEVIERFSGYSYVECKLETGRTHQIRVHMAHIGHPVLGDMVYGHKKPELGIEGQCLHAKELRFIHPRTGKMLTVSCPLPDYFEDILRKLRAKSK